MRRLIGLSVVLAALFGVFWILRPLSEAEVRDFIEPTDAFAAPLYVAVGGVLGALLVPGPLLAGASGLLFGTLTGFFVTIASAVVSALISRAIGARAARNSPAHDAALAVTVRRHGVLAVIAQRLAPVVPDGPFNYAFGVAGVGAWPLVLGTLIGSSPRAFAYTALGDSIDDPASPLFIVAVAVVVLTGALGAVIALRMRRTQ
ncbi:MAG: VTT domain-containing protein [Solirubrobacteraceae bacterium]